MSDGDLKRFLHPCISVNDRRDGGLSLTDLFPAIAAKSTSGQSERSADCIGGIKGQIWTLDKKRIGIFDLNTQHLLEVRRVIFGVLSNAKF